MKNVIFLLVILFPMVSFSQNNNDTLIYKKQYIELLNRVKNLEEKVNTNKAELQKAKTALELSEMYTKSADKSLNLIMNIIKSIGVLVTLLGIGGVVGLFKYLRNLKNWFREYSEEEISKIMDEKKETIKELIKKHSHEKTLLEKSKILILNKEGSGVANHLDTILNKFVSTYATETITDLNTHNFKNDFSKFDVVVFDNLNTKTNKPDWDFENNDDDKNKLVEIAKKVCSKGVAFFFNGSNDGRFAKDPNAIDPQYLHLINFSQNPATVFSNLIDLLDLREILSNG